MDRWQRLWSFAFTLVLAIVFVLDSPVVYWFEASPEIRYPHPFTVEAALCSPRSGYSFCAVLTQVHTQNGASDSGNFPVGVIGTCNGSSGTGFCTGSNIDLRTTGNGGKIQHTASGWIIAGTYGATSGTHTGTGTCNLSSFTSVTGATATVPVTAGVIAPGTPLTITAIGSAGSGNNFVNATLSNGTATCSGTASTNITIQNTAVPTDVVFTSDSAGVTLLPFEVASYTASTGQFEGYVNLSISATLDTLFYTSFGNASQTTYLGSMTGTWNSAFINAIHFGNVTTSGSTVTAAFDSTSNANNLGASGSSASIPTGIAGNGAGFTGGGGISSGASTSGAFNNYPSGHNVRTLEAWINKNNVAFNSAQSPAGWGDGGNGLWCIFGCSACVTSGNEMLINTFGAGFRTTITQNSNWQYIVGTLPSGTTVNSIVEYINAVSVGAVFGSGTTINTPSSGVNLNFQVGNTSGSSANFTGSVDEVRVSNVARSADWITATYNNLNTPGSFVTASNMSTGGGNMPPAIF